MSTENRNRGKEYYSQALIAIQRINKAEEKKIVLSQLADEVTEDDEFENIGLQIQECDSTISKQVDAALNNFKDAMKYFTEGRKYASAEKNGQEW